MTYPFVSVVIPNWNGKKHLEVCLLSLMAQTHTNFEIIIVDNGSSDQSVEFVKKNYSSVKLISNSDNLGFAKATNQGIIDALKNKNVKYIATLNNDTRVKAKWLEELVKVAESDVNIGSCQSKMLNFYQPNIIDTIGIRIFKSFSVTGRGQGEIDQGQYDEVEEIFGACAGAALYKREMLLKIGLFDENFFAYLEDVDLAWRAHLAGWKCMYVPAAIVYHVHSATGGHKSSFSRYMGSRNRVWLIIKNASFKNLLYNLPLMIIWDFVDIFYAIIKYRDLVQLKGKISALSSAHIFLNKRKNTIKFNKYKNIQNDFLEPFSSFILFEYNKLSAFIKKVCLL